MNTQPMHHTVLLIDDDRNVLHGLARVLRSEPYRLYTVSSGEEAILAIKSQKIDVVVVDEQMPGIQGDELIAWIAGHCPQVVRIMLTGQPSLDVAIRAINQGHVFQFLVKPCNPAHLSATIQKAIEQKELAEKNALFAEANRRLEEEWERGRADLAALRRIVELQIQTPLQALLRSSQPAARSACVNSDDRRLLEQALGGLDEAGRLMGDLERERVARGGVTIPSLRCAH